MSDERESQAVEAAAMFIAAYTNENAAQTVLEGLVLTDMDDDSKFGDAASIRKDADGKVHIIETGDTKTKEGAAIGGLLGALVGLLAGPEGAVAGAAGGAALGGAGAMKAVTAVGTEPMHILPTLDSLKDALGEAR